MFESDVKPKVNLCLGFTFCLNTSHIVMVHLGSRGPLTFYHSTECQTADMRHDTLLHHIIDNGMTCPYSFFLTTNGVDVLITVQPQWFPLSLNLLITGNIAQAPTGPNFLKHHKSVTMVTCVISKF